MYKEFNVRLFKLHAFPVNRLLDNQISCKFSIEANASIDPSKLLNERSIVVRVFKSRTVSGILPCSWFLSSSLFLSQNNYSIFSDLNDEIDSGIVPSIGLDTKLLAWPMVEPFPRLITMIFSFSSQKTGDAEFQTASLGLEISQHLPFSHV